MIKLLAMIQPAMVLLQRENEFLFRSEKIYTVLSVVLIIFIGLIVYLFMMDRKVGKLEQRVNDIAAGSQHNSEDGV